jgi:hypothetical protein
MLGGSPSERMPVLESVPCADFEGVAHRCPCASDTPAARFGCIDCGAPCCSACAITLESVGYCRRCATALLGAAAMLNSGSFELY